MNSLTDRSKLVELAEAVAPGVSRVRPAVFRTVSAPTRAGVAPEAPPQEGPSSRGSVARRAYAAPTHPKNAQQGHQHQPAPAPARATAAPAHGPLDVEERLAPLRGLARELVSRGMPGPLVSELLAEIVSEFGNQVLESDQDARYALVEQLLLRLAGDPLIEPNTAPTGSFIISGPSGSGKDVLVAHMALAAAKQGHRDIVLVNTEGQRIGAVAQMEALGTVFNCKVAHVYTPQELSDLHATRGPKTLFLVLAASWSPANNADLQSSSWTWKLPSAERVVCVPATGQGEDLHELLAAARQLALRPLAVLSKTDETRNVLPSLGALASARQSVSMVIRGDNFVYATPAPSLAMVVRSALGVKVQPRKKGRVVC